MSNHLFERASRERWRFPTVKGAVSTEELWIMPLTTDKSYPFCLDDVARTINSSIDSKDNVSFVNKKPEGNELAEAQLAMIKHIIAVRLAEEESKKNAKVRAEQKQKILEALADRENSDLKSKSKEELMEMLKDL